MPDIDLMDMVSLIEQANELGVKLSFGNGDLIVQVNKENKIDPVFFTALKANRDRLKEYFRRYSGSQHEKTVNNAIRAFDRQAIKNIKAEQGQ